MNAIKDNLTPKNMWSFLVTCSLLAFLWVFSGFVVKYFVYVKQANHSIAEVFDWGIVEMDEDNFVICADFRFHTDGVDEYSSQYLFEKISYPTKELAEQAKTMMRAKEWKCYWFGSAKDPKVSMERNFPVKEFSYAMLVLSVAVYFMIMKRKYLSSL